MEFDNSQPIYIQIADYVCDRILAGILEAGGKVPSVRELAIALEVNPNTVMRSFDFLQQQSIIYTKRGMGYFVELSAKSQIEQRRKEAFIMEELPRLFVKMQQLNLSINDIDKEYQNFKSAKT